MDQGRPQLLTNQVKPKLCTVVLLRTRRRSREQLLMGRTCRRQTKEDKRWRSRRLERLKMRIHWYRSNSEPNRPSSQQTSLNIKRTFLSSSIVTKSTQNWWKFLTKERNCIKKSKGRGKRVVVRILRTKGWCRRSRRSRRIRVWGRCRTGFLSSSTPTTASKSK